MCSSGGQVAVNDAALQEADLAATKAYTADANVSFAENQAVQGAQMAKLNYLTANPMGYTPAQLHTATTSINENTATAAKHAIGAAAGYAAAHGGADVGGGGASELAGQIMSGAAQSKAQSLSALSQQNEELKQKNMWSALSGLQEVGSGYGSTFNTGAGAGSSASTAGVGAGGGVEQAKYAGMEAFGSVLSGVAGLGKAAISPWAK